MPFLRNSLYLTLHWASSAVPLETGQTGVRVDSQVAVTQALVDSVSSPALTFWRSVGMSVDPSLLLKFIRLARLGPDGKYIPGSVAFDSVYSGANAGTGTGSPVYPIQVALASTLTTPVPRGPAALGRMFLPPPSSVLSSTDMRFTAAVADARSAAVATFLTALKTPLGGPAAVMSKGTAQAPGGATQIVTGVKTGRRPDVQRRRGRALSELYGATSAVT